MVAGSVPQVTRLGPAVDCVASALAPGLVVVGLSRVDAAHFLILRWSMSDRKQAATRILSQVYELCRHLRVLATSDDPVQLCAAQSSLEDFVGGDDRIRVGLPGDTRTLFNWRDDWLSE